MEQTFGVKKGFDLLQIHGILIALSNWRAEKAIAYESYRQGTCPNGTLVVGP